MHMKKEEFYFDSRDGKNKIHAVRYTPDDGVVCCVVQIVHGMSEYVERYEELAQFLTEKGFVVTGEDHLGHGKTVPEGGTYRVVLNSDDEVWGGAGDLKETRFRAEKLPCGDFPYSIALDLPPLSVLWLEKERHRHRNPCLR